MILLIPRSVEIIEKPLRDEISGDDSSGQMSSPIQVWIRICRICRKSRPVKLRNSVKLRLCESSVVESFPSNGSFSFGRCNILPHLSLEAVQVTDLKRIIFFILHFMINSKSPCWVGVLSILLRFSLLSANSKKKVVQVNFYRGFMRKNLLNTHPFDSRLFSWSLHFLQGLELGRQYSGGASRDK